MLLLILLPFCGVAEAASIGFASGTNGEEALNQQADLAFNPASVVKMATTWWALETLGPDHRFLTRFVKSPGARIEEGVLHGDLWVLGGNDPDFHRENAWQVAFSLKRCGIERVTGSLRVVDGFWIGWEGGAEAKPVTPAERRREMAARLAHAWQPASWTDKELDQYRTWADTHGMSTAPSLDVGAIDQSEAPPSRFLPLVEHRGNRLAEMLRRFNAYSNNDLERLGETLGPPASLTNFLKRSMPGLSIDPQLETLSGLGRNRLSPRTVVTLLQTMEPALHKMNLELDSVFPVSGCDPGTLERYRGLGRRSAGRLVAKTGTLIKTDGGVSVIAGSWRDRNEPIYFCLAETNAGKNIAAARSRIETRLLALLPAAHEASAGDAESACGPPLADADSDIILTIDRSTNDASPTRSIKPQ
jgi:D-alanyl-D-alanine carboxypeptidase/D-alanyl-D-alanine-endopeptidase (penicillin-binding protein 4)